jgi:hypothetical protein
VLRGAESGGREFHFVLITFGGRFSECVFSVMLMDAGSEYFGVRSNTVIDRRVTVAMCVSRGTPAMRR